MIPAFLMSRFAGPIAAAVALLSILGNVVLGLNYWASERSNGKLTTQVISLAGNLQQCRANNELLEQARQTQNASIDNLKLTGELAAANAARAQAQAERDGAVFRERATSLKAARPGRDKCASAAKLIDDTLAGERK